ncbi:MAG: ATP-binding protein [Calditrichaeota bacterium]|nr:ATP-binding protein [Calditrichota bacterium]
MEVEITNVDPLTDEQKASLDLHSFLNIFNVLAGELQYIGILLEKESFLRNSIEICRSLKTALSDNSDVKMDPVDIENVENAIITEINNLLVNHPKSGDYEIAESITNIHSIFNVMQVRVHELLARQKSSDKWIKISIENLTIRYVEMLTAIEKNSKGRYKIVYNRNEKTDNDYLVQLKFKNSEYNYITMPISVQDVMGDLIANARKYTKPGGQITAEISEDDFKLMMLVEDTGIGIPADEIEKVVRYGERASNARDLRTMGGGFGLTKAYFTIKQFNGRMWIKSDFGRGTKITIEIPKPDIQNDKF